MLSPTYDLDRVTRGEHGGVLAQDLLHFCWFTSHWPTGPLTVGSRLSSFIVLRV